MPNEELSLHAVWDKIGDNRVWQVNFVATLLSEDGLSKIKDLGITLPEGVLEEAAWLLEQYDLRSEGELWAQESGYSPDQK